MSPETTAPLILAIDQGTTSSRAVLFDQQLHAVNQAQEAFAQSYPNPGWVEQNAMDIWHTVLNCCRQLLTPDTLPRVQAIGITNQRETTIVWDRQTGEPIAPAIVWQDRRTHVFCAELMAQHQGQRIRENTGLPIDPYFSGTKIRWLLDNIPGARARAENGELAFGTVDCWLLWQLTGGQRHATDATNACRTQLFNIHTQQWDAELLKLMNIPASMLPEVLDCAADFGHTDPALFGKAVPILGIAGDQQAATIGQQCVAAGQAKCTFGTGAFLMLNTGETAVASRNRLLTTLAYRLDNKVHYALEGSVFIAGSAVQWLRDGLSVINASGDTERLAQSLKSDQGVMMVPAFTGLGAPHWRADARAAIFGMELSTGPAQLAYACLQSIALQVNDLLQAIRADGQTIDTLRIDGGMTANEWFVEQLAWITQTPLFRPDWQESTVLGAARLAAHQLGWTKLTDDHQANTRGRHFPVPEAGTQRNLLITRWQNAIKATLVFAGD